VCKSGELVAPEMSNSPIKEGEMTKTCKSITHLRTASRVCSRGSLLSRWCLFLYVSCMIFLKFRAQI